MPTATAKQEKLRRVKSCLKSQRFKRLHQMFDDLDMGSLGSLGRQGWQAGRAAQFSLEKSKQNWMVSKTTDWALMLS